MSLADAATAGLRRLEAERAHRLALLGLRTGLHPRGGPGPDILSVEIAGLKLANRVGLAAGFDKDAEAFGPLLETGFGFVECGTVTPRPQPGNPRPRLFRLEADGAVINRMGFNSGGLDGFARRLERGRGRSRRGAVGANLGANKDSEDRVGDYVLGLKRLEGLCDYFTVNISSPNTPGLRDLQEAEALERLLGRVSEARRGATPVFLKVAPDLDAESAPRIAAAVRRRGLDGLIVSNTTIRRPAGLRGAAASEAGGLSGRPLKSLALQALRTFHAADPDLPLIGVGGIESGADAFERLEAGARAVQLYTALVFQGPGLVERLKRELAGLMAAPIAAPIAAEADEAVASAAAGR